MCVLVVACTVVFELLLRSEAEERVPHPVVISRHMLKRHLHNQTQDETSATAHPVHPLSLSFFCTEFSLKYQAIAKTSV